MTPKRGTQARAMLEAMFMAYGRIRKIAKGMRPGKNTIQTFGAGMYNEICHAYVAAREWEKRQQTALVSQCCVAEVWSLSKRTYVCSDCEQVCKVREAKP